MPRALLRRRSHGGPRTPSRHPSGRRAPTRSRRGRTSPPARAHRAARAPSGSACRTRSAARTSPAPTRRAPRATPSGSRSPSPLRPSRTRGRRCGRRGTSRARGQQLRTREATSRQTRAPRPSSRPRGSTPRRQYSPEPLQTVRRPQRLRVVVLVEGRRVVRQDDPADLRLRIDMDVGRDALRIVERAAADEANGGAAVLTEDRDLAVGAAIDALLAAVVARHVDRLRLAREHLDSVALYEQVDDERAPRLPLAVQAVAAVDEERFGAEPIANGATGATSFTRVAQLTTNTPFIPDAACPATVHLYG